jgi:hypothetical protein
MPPRHPWTQRMRVRAKRQMQRGPRPALPGPTCLAAPRAPSWLRAKCRRAPATQAPSDRPRTPSPAPHPPACPVGRRTSEPNLPKAPNRAGEAPTEPRSNFGRPRTPGPARGAEVSPKCRRSVAEVSPKCRRPARRVAEVSSAGASCRRSVAEVSPKCRRSVVGRRIVSPKCRQSVAEVSSKCRRPAGRPPETRRQALHLSVTKLPG